MAKATVTCTCKVCGATFTREAFKRNRAEADNWEAWAAENIDTCPSCYQAEKRQAEAERVAARSQQLPQLEGSEKQVAWANTIRDRMISENHLARGIRDGEFINQDGTTLTFQQAQEFWAAADSTPEQKSAADAIIKLFTETQAKWFIDHRFDKI